MRNIVLGDGMERFSIRFDSGRVERIEDWATDLILSMDKMEEGSIGREMVRQQFIGASMALNMLGLNLDFDGDRAKMAPFSEVPSGITVSEAAEVLGVSVGRVRQLLSEGRLVGEKSGGVWLVERWSIDDYIDSRWNRGRSDGD